MNEVVVGTIFVEAMDLVAVVSLEEMEDVVEEVMDLDDGLIGERRQIDRDVGGAGIGTHGDQCRISGWTGRDGRS